MIFQKRDIGQLANFGERSGKMSHRQNYLSWLFRQITAANHDFTDEFLEKLMPWSDQAQENC